MAKIENIKQQSGHTDQIPLSNPDKVENISMIHVVE